MDVRLSSEQQALHDSVAQVIGRLGPGTVRDLDDAERTVKLDAAVAASGWRELRVAAGRRAPLASGVEAAIVAEELGRGLADTPFLGPTLAAELRRLAGAPAGYHRRDGRLHRLAGRPRGSGRVAAPRRRRPRCPGRHRRAGAGARRCAATPWPKSPLAPGHAAAPT